MLPLYKAQSVQKSSRELNTNETRLWKFNFHAIKKRDVALQNSAPDTNRLTLPSQRGELISCSSAQIRPSRRSYVWSFSLDRNVGQNLCRYSLAVGSLKVYEAKKNQSSCDGTCWPIPHFLWHSLWWTWARSSVSWRTKSSNCRSARCGAWIRALFFRPKAWWFQSPDRNRLSNEKNMRCFQHKFGHAGVGSICDYVFVSELV